LDGFIKMARVAPIRTNQRDLQEPAPKRMLQENGRRKNEKICAILEFLEGDTRRLDNQISKDDE
jgi:hypothetical protein